MAKFKKHLRNRTELPQNNEIPESEPAGSQPEKEPAAEWGERIDTGKTIARGGKSDGHVPGAMESEAR